jgi:hypothetical protein
MLGTSVTWTATVQNAASGHTYDYQYTVTFNGRPQIVRDFNPIAIFLWVPHTVEGAYQVSVVVRDITTSPFVRFAPVSVNFDLLPWVTTPKAAGVVNPTSHPLVALFSGPPCATGDQLLVRFHPSNSQVSMTTNAVPCSQNSANLLIAGMYPSTKYLMHWEEYNGTNLVSAGSDLAFTTGPLPSNFPALQFHVNVPATADDAAYPVVLWQFLTSWPRATDLAGNVLWYAPNILIARMEPGGTYYSYGPIGPFDGNGTMTQYDLAGNPVLQTNLEILNEQLSAKGYPTMNIFNGHEIRNLPNGNLLLLGSRDVVSTSAQGGTPSQPVDIVGDMVLVLDHNLQLVWAWDSFAHEDINREATLGDLCLPINGCSGLGSNFTTGKDWLHTNAAQGTGDGNIILSQRSQDFVIKINYDNGAGDGSVIWRMGAGGDFTIVNLPGTTCGTTLDVFPWFTHQHDSSFQFEEDTSSGGDVLMTVFDDGNTRHTECSGTQNSRGMVLLINEAARQVNIETSADLGGYSPFLGSGQLLTPPDGKLYASFDNPAIGNSPYVAQATEVNFTGQILYQLQVDTDSYRTYRLQDLYTPTLPDSGNVGANGAAVPPNEPFDFRLGFSQDQTSLQFNGNASISGGSLQLTDGQPFEASSAFYATPVNVQSFTTDFTFQLTNPAADGFTFTIQNTGVNALGGFGGTLGYAPSVGRSVAIKFDLHDNAGEGLDSTGLFADGILPTVPSIDLTGTGIDLHSGDKMSAHITYNGTTLNLTITDTITSATWSRAFPVNIPAIVGGSTAYVGFTAATGELASTQQILNWSYVAAQVPYDPKGFPSATGLSTSGSASIAGTALQLTNGGLFQSGSAFSTTPVNIQSFNTDFKFQLTNPAADGFTFAIQSGGPHALGSGGGSLGYAGIPKSVAIKFDLHDNSGEGQNSTGLYINGALPTIPATDLTGTGINLHSGDQMDANISYDGETLTLMITDLVTLAKWSRPFVVNIPAYVGGNTAYVGFTGATGNLTATQQIIDWTFE